MKMIKVLMLGPNRKAKGGVTSVVNQYFDHGLHEMVDLKYIPTATDTHILSKYLTFSCSIIYFLVLVHRYDIVHIHMASRNSFKRKRFFVFAAKTMFHKKVIVHLHGAEFKQFYENESNNKQKKIVKNTFQQVDQVIALSDEWKTFIQTNFPKAKVVVVHNAVPVSKLVESYHNKQILFLGRVGKRKGIYDLIHAISKVNKIYPNIVLHIAGDGEIENAKVLCKTLSVEDTVHFYGWINSDKKDDLLNSCSIFCLPSYNEGLPMSMLEAMSHGVAVIVSNVGGIPSVIQNGYNGLMIDAGDVDGLTKKILNLIMNDDYKRTLGINAHKTIVEHYSIQNHIKKIIEIYNNI